MEWMECETESAYVVRLTPAAVAAASQLSNPVFAELTATIVAASRKKPNLHSQNIYS